MELIDKDGEITIAKHWRFPRVHLAVKLRWLITAKGPKEICIHRQLSLILLIIIVINLHNKANIYDETL